MDCCRYMHRVAWTTWTYSLFLIFMPIGCIFSTVVNSCFALIWTRIVFVSEHLMPTTSNGVNWRILPSALQPDIMVEHNVAPVRQLLMQLYESRNMGLASRPVADVLMFRVFANNGDRFRCRYIYIYVYLHWKAFPLPDHSSIPAPLPFLPIPSISSIKSAGTCTFVVTSDGRSKGPPVR